MKLISIFKEYDKLYKIWEAAIAGLKNRDKLENFEFNMETFGGYDYKHEYCYGCLATCTIFNIVDAQPNKVNIFRRKHPQNGYTLSSIHRFEDVIDSLRLGDIRNAIFDLYYYLDREGAANIKELYEDLKVLLDLSEDDQQEDTDHYAELNFKLRKDVLGEEPFPSLIGKDLFEDEIDKFIEVSEKMIVKLKELDI